MPEDAPDSNIALSQAYGQALERNMASKENGQQTGSAYVTPKLGASENGMFDGSDGQTPIVKGTKGKSESADVDENGDGDDDDDAPLTARPKLESHRTRTVSSRSSNLHELASLHQPDEPTTLVVGTANGSYFEEVELVTPTMQHLNNSRADEISASVKEKRDRRRDKVRSVGGSEYVDIASMEKGPSTNRRSKSTQGRTMDRSAISDTNGYRFSSDDSVDDLPRQPSAYIPSENRLTSAVMPQEPHEVQAELPSSISSTYKQRSSISSSSSSLAESAGTAAEGTDSEYEERRSAFRAGSDPGSRRPRYTDVPDMVLKRLSSFAPIPPMGNMSSNGSTTHLAANYRNNPGTSPDAVSRTSVETAHPHDETDLPSHPDNASERSHKVNQDLPPSPQTAPTMAQVESIQSNASAASTSSDVTSLASATSESTSRSSSPSSAKIESQGPSTASNITSGSSSQEGNNPSPRRSKKQRPTALQKAISRTRQKDLPPKPEEEDVSICASIRNGASDRKW